MTHRQALIALSRPGTSALAPLHPLLIKLQELATAAGLRTEWADTVPGWGCLNQDWLHIWCPVDTSWNWCVPLFLTPDQRTEFALQLHHGNLIMMVWYDAGEPAAPWEPVVVHEPNDWAVQHKENHLLTGSWPTEAEAQRVASALNGTRYEPHH